MWDRDAGRWVTVLAPACSGCSQIVAPLDHAGRCSDCALYDEMGLELTGSAG